MPLVGNSYAGFNDLGGLIAGIARVKADGPTITPTLEALGGMTLGQHMESGATGDLVASGTFDRVVLQKARARFSGRAPVSKVRRPSAGTTSWIA